MKKILITMLFSLLLVNINAEPPKEQYHDNAGIAISISGITLCTIGLFIPDGSEWSYVSPLPTNSQIIIKPFYQNPARDATILIGAIFTIGGIKYQKNHK